MTVPAYTGRLGFFMDEIRVDKGCRQKHPKKNKVAADRAVKPESILIVGDEFMMTPYNRINMEGFGYNQTLYYYEQS